MGVWLEGKSLANRIKEGVKEKVEYYKREINQVPGLIGILVGEDRASQVYLRTKEKNSQKLGINSEILTYPKDIKLEKLKAEIERLNQRDDVDGILVQLPLPPPLNPHEVITAILPEKDVDGFHPFSLGNLLLNKRGLRPCTPCGIIEILKDNNIAIEGKRVVIIGRSLIVGKPLAVMMTNENGTVTACHSKTKDLPAVASEADILVAALGKGAFVTPEFVKEGAAVIDVGINHVTDRKRVEDLFGKDPQREKELSEKGYTIIGDVHPQVIEKAAYLTPVPGGVGALTVAMLMQNTLEAFIHRRGLQER